MWKENMVSRYYSSTQSPLKSCTIIVCSYMYPWIWKLFTIDVSVEIIYNYLYSIVALARFIPSSCVFRVFLVFVIWSCFSRFLKLFLWTWSCNLKFVYVNDLLMLLNFVEYLEYIVILILAGIWCFRWW